MLKKITSSLAFMPLMAAFTVCLTASLSLYTVCHAALPIGVSIPPQKNLVERIGGEHVDVTVLLPAGSDPHTFEPKPSQLRDMSKVTLYISVGMPFEDAWLPRLMEVSGGALRIVPMHEKLVSPEHAAPAHAASEHNQTDGHDHSKCGGPNDPHRWLSPMLMRHMGLEIRKALVKADPDNAPTYRANYRKLAEELTNLDAQLNQILLKLPADRRRFMVFHPAWLYFANSYNLEEIAIEVDGREPTPQQLMKIIDAAREHDIKTIFIQPQFSKRIAETIAQEIGNGIKLIEADPMAEDWAQGIENIAHQLVQDSQ